MDRLFEAKVPMNGQIVLCRGINDKEELGKTIGDLAKYLPYMESVSVVPVGLSKFREGLEPLEPFDKKAAEEALEIIEEWQKKIFKENGTHFIHASDEFYILAERELPKASRYDGYPQLENGVGMLRLLLDEFEEAYSVLKGDHKKRSVSLATGYLAYPYIKRMAGRLMEKCTGTKVYVYPVKNDFFGELITVSGLITGKDLIRQLKGQPLGERLLLPCSMFRSGETVFLDDITLKDVTEALQVEADIVKSSGQDFIDAIIRGD